MKRGRITWLAVIAAVLNVLRVVHTEPTLLKDIDTSVLLDAIRNRHNPLSWFTGDWPLANHFYRPIPTLTFEADNVLYANHAAGYGWTNALICVACILALFWMVAELSESLALAGACALLFGYWHAPFYLPLSPVVDLLVGATVVVALLRRQAKWTQVVSACLLTLLTYAEFNGLRTNLQAGSLSWLPARTATVMTVFCLTSVAAYARYARFSSTKATEEITPLTPPATRSSRQEKKAKGSVVWLGVSVAMAAVALGSYEQAIMLPAVLLASAVMLRMRGYRVGWALHALFWLLLGGYLLMRHQILPPTTSAYQKQQLRYGPGVFYALSDYFLPVSAVTYGFIQAFSGLYELVNSAFYTILLSWATQVNGYIAARKEAIAIGGLVTSFLAFLPMAWVKEFPHYHYWPMAMRTMFVTGLIVLAGRALVTAWSPRVQQAPTRPSPAPGSLPRP